MKAWKIASAVFGAGVAITAIVIMARGAGLQEGLDFGAGSYYYADIPEFDRYTAWDAFQASLPYWVYVLLFLAWGALMYLLWRRVDRGWNPAATGTGSAAPSLTRSASTSPKGGNSPWSPKTTRRKTAFRRKSC